MSNAEPIAPSNLDGLSREASLLVWDFFVTTVRYLGCERRTLSEGFYLETMDSAREALVAYLKKLESSAGMGLPHLTQPRPAEQTMKGRSPIVLAVKQEGFREHPTLDSAEREAHRLVTVKGIEEAVVYVPKRIVRHSVVTEHIRGNGRPESKDAPVLKPALSRATPADDDIQF